MERKYETGVIRKVQQFPPFLFSHNLSVEYYIQYVVLLQAFFTDILKSDLLMKFVHSFSFSYNPNSLCLDLLHSVCCKHFPLYIFTFFRI